MSSLSLSLDVVSELSPKVPFLGITSPHTTLPQNLSLEKAQEKSVVVLIEKIQKYVLHLYTRDMFPFEVGNEIVQEKRCF